MKKGTLKKLAALALAAGMTVSCAACAAKQAEEPAELTASLTARTVTADEQDCAGVNNFGTELLRRAAGRDTNPVISPLSAYLALGMTMNGAGGDTLSEFSAVLGGDNGYVNTLSSYITQSLEETKGSTILNIANSAWVDTQANIYESFLEDALDYYGAQVFSADLDTGEARKAINSWTEEHTQGLIPELLEENLSQYTVLALINTLYMKAKWQTTFKYEATYDQVFYREGAGEVTVPFMHSGIAQRDYINTGDVEGVILPYDDGRLALTILRPAEGNTVRGYLETLTSGKLSDIIAGAKSTSVRLSMPKFQIEYSLFLNDILAAMGLESAFDPDSADFSRMGESRYEDGNIYISMALQKVKIIVDEEGTEAAAATIIAAGDGASMMPDKYIELTLDSPFIYAVTDLETGAVLFMGVLDDPS
ncbi:MAG: serpin family protein [Oscillospiraceae bacterium]